MFYHFSQNNSGGSFHYDDKAGLTHHVVVEAANVEEANKRAEEAGVYFNGCAAGRDCDCCGDRWYGAYGEGTEKPTVYGDELTEDWKPSFMRWMDGFEAFVHYADGTVKGFGGGSRHGNEIKGKL